MLRLEDIGALGYGAIVTGAGLWDQRRIDAGTITNKEVFKKMETWAYLVPGLTALVSSGMGWMPKQAGWIDRVSTGFIYDVPRFMKNIWESQRTETATKSRAVQEAQRIIQQHSATTRQQLTSGKATQRYPSPVITKEFQDIRLVG